MSRIIGQKTTQTYIIRKYTSMQNWPKGLLCAPAAFFHRAREERNQQRQLRASATCEVVSEPLF